MRGPQFIRRRSGPGLFTEARRVVGFTFAAIIGTVGGLTMVMLIFIALKLVGVLL